MSPGLSGRDDGRGARRDGGQVTGLLDVHHGDARRGTQAPGTTSSARRSHSTAATPLRCHAPHHSAHPALCQLLQLDFRHAGRTRHAASHASPLHRPAGAATCQSLPLSTTAPYPLAPQFLYGPAHPTTKLLLVEVLYLCHCALESHPDHTIDKPRWFGGRYSVRSDLLQFH